MERALSCKIRFLVEGEGRPVTLIHGVGSNLKSWYRVAKRLKPEFLVIRMDPRGHGPGTPGRGPWRTSFPAWPGCCMRSAFPYGEDPPPLTNAATKSTRP